MDGIRKPATKQPSDRGRINKPTDGKTRQAEPKISPIMGALLVATALFFDGAQYIVEVIGVSTAILTPLAIAGGWLIDIFAWLTFFIWFHSLGLGTIKKGGSGSSTAPFISIAFAFGIEFMPIINLLPAWTVSILIILIRDFSVRLAKFGNL